MSKRVLLVPEVAEQLRVKPARIYDLIRDGRLKAIRVGRQLRIDADQLDAWLAGGGVSLQAN